MDDSLPRKTCSIYTIGAANTLVIDLPLFSKASGKCVVIDLGASIAQFQHPMPPLEDHHYTGITFQRTPHLLRTIAPGPLNTNRVVGQLTTDGEQEVK